MTLMKSWVDSANDANHPFPLNNLPYGVFSTEDGDPRCGVAIGDMIFDVTAAESEDLIALTDYPLFDVPFWNELMEEGPAVWAALRERLIALLSEGSADRATVEPLLVPMVEAQMHLPFAVSEYTDFYAGKNHAVNVGTMFRGPENALPPNWLHIPIGYNGRASSVVVSGTDVRRPWGQLKSPEHDMPAFLPSRRFDIELEMGAIVGTSSDGPISVQEADNNIFGYVLLNDWSARDIQAWEYQPLGPFQAKATATTISPWIVTKAALNPFRCDTPTREVALLDHLKDCGPMLYDIDLEVTMQPEGSTESTITRTNYKEMYYSAAQQLAHHSTSGCPMNTGDLLGSGTISGTTKESRGSLLELSWGGKEPLTLPTGETRSFIEDNDTLTLKGAAKGDGYTIGFGTCVGKVLPALDDPYKR
ncbi:fumarylacetoacetase [Thalassovita gelatinovora]|uniref:fumarylacetoacetase n=1 Tax=Thalassovita gelatinovora TaxID=53501 RepID=A0A0P1FDH8_THAGE|nr:fumarylacetoacetase [Thalassovita gelatinovora]QIZ80596.1 fumarylacetoacetase [Thalassovita gelatinovora]CUH66132.1 fumarylacetoacetase [Thalassovita gelatinovora]SEQ77457.1 fumarylacetoacetate hydrolase [Thalassovita gelatinovora]